MRRRGFTLIELLVVIAIIAILAAILFPVFAQARNKARQTACVSNIRQCWLSITMYRTDYDNFYPYGIDIDPSRPITDCSRWNINQALFTWEGPYNLSSQGIGCVMVGSAFPNELPTPNGPRPVLSPYLKDNNVIYCPNVPECWKRGTCPNPYGANGSFYDPARTRGRSSYYYPHRDRGAFLYTGSSSAEATQLANENLIWGRSDDSLDDRVRILLDNYLIEQRHTDSRGVHMMVAVFPSGSTRVWKWYYPE